jgi:hypothetical protein
MYIASVKTDPDELVFATLSLPAKSTRLSLERLTTSEPSWRTSSWIVKIQWDLDDALK